MPRYLLRRYRVLVLVCEVRNFIDTHPQDAMDLLEPTTKDPVDFGRGAFISLSVILVQQSDAAPSLTSARQLFSEIVVDEFGDALSRFRHGTYPEFHRRRLSEFNYQPPEPSRPQEHATNHGDDPLTQFWYWFPFTHSLYFACVRADCYGSCDRWPPDALKCKVPSAE